MKHLFGLLSVVMLAACGGEAGSAATLEKKGEASQTGQQPPAPTPARDEPAPKTGGDGAREAGKGRESGFAGRTRRVTNPDGLVMVLLYNQLAGLTPPFSEWIEKDIRVSNAPPIEKPEVRKTIAAEFSAAAEAVKDIGAIRITTNTQLSEYDPTYGEYLISALDPSSMFTFSANGQTVRLKYSNADAAQIWRVPQDQYQAIEDRIRYRGSLSLTIDADIESVQPGVNGGDIVARITGYVLENSFNSGLIARVAVDDDGG